MRKISNIKEVAKRKGASTLKMNALKKIDKVEVRKIMARFNTGPRISVYKIHENGETVEQLWLWNF